MRNENLILIASSSPDEHTYGPVSHELEKRGFPVVTYKTDQVLNGEELFRLSVSDAGELSIEYEGISITPDAVAAGWYRKVTNFALPNVDQNLSKQQYMNNEVRSLHGTIWPLFPEEMWLNSPQAISQGEQKIRQLIVARQVGFTILETLISNDWDAVGSMQQRHGNSTLAFKMMRGIIADNNTLKGVHTTPLDAEALGLLRTHTVPFPGLLQPFLPKYREWRVTAAGEDVFSAAIYTSDEAKDDWRKHQSSGAVTFKAEDVGDEVSEQCVMYLQTMGLKFGAFDFIESPDGEITFLECNPNGQYGWLEELFDFSITNSIANHLAAIAKARN